LWKGDLLGAADLQSLAALDGFDELARLDQGLVRAGIEPRVSASERHDVQLAGIEIADG